MAAAEARAAWQRANRCFVQEDAKRPPKLACSSLSKQFETNPPTNGNDDFAPPTANSRYSNLSPDSRWWLHLQPNYKGLGNEKWDVLEAEKSHEFADIMDSQSTVKDSGVEESYEFVEMDSVCKKLDEFSLESEFPHWMESEKNQELPWWRMTDKDDLASYVAQKSQDFVENCDLPRPWNTSFKKDNQSIHKKDEILTNFGDLKREKRRFQNEVTVHSSRDTGSGSGPFSPSSPHSVESTLHEGDTATHNRKLLEALRHSQTRAREAEKAAKQAHAEKEHVMKLIFKQASQLFAYKQWLYLLQLENLYNQIKTNKITASPWHGPRRKTRRNLRSEKKPREKRGVGVPSCKHDNLGKYVVTLAVGLGIVGAGLVLGWTVGWMFI